MKASGFLAAVAGIILSTGAASAQDAAVGEKVFEDANRATRSAKAPRKPSAQS